MSALVTLLSRGPADDTLGARISFLQEAILAIDAATAAGDLDGDAIALDLKASLGAIVAWGRGPRDADSQLQLQALLTGLLARATSTLHRTLATQWRQIADAAGDAVDETRARTLAAAFARAADAIDAGEAIDAATAALLTSS